MISESGKKVSIDTGGSNLETNTAHIINQAINNDKVKYLNLCNHLNQKPPKKISSFFNL